MMSENQVNEKMLARRELLKLAPLAALGAFAVPRLQSRLLDGGRNFMSRAQLSLSSAGLAPTFTKADLTPLQQFPINSYLTEDPGIDLVDWRLNVAGAVARPGEYTLDQLKALPHFTQNTRHICIEGWAVIGSFTGVRLRDVLAHCGADPAARFIEFECADDYYETLDLAGALHPQTMLCYEMYGQPLPTAHGAPLRLQMPTRLGYKQAKYLVGLKVSHVATPRKGYWVDQGYPESGKL